MKNYFYLKILSLFIIFFCLSVNTYAINSYSFLYANINPSILQVPGTEPGGQFGADIKTADLKGDGEEEIIVSSPFASKEDKKWLGMIKIGDNITLWGENHNDQLGTSITVGDFNNNGIDDLAISSFNTSHKDENKGKVYVFYGGDKWIEKINKYTLDEETNIIIPITDSDLIIYEEENNSGFGLNLATGDFNNNGIDDLIISAPFSFNKHDIRSGVVYIYLGNLNGISPLYNYELHGKIQNERFGSAIALGDVNNDKKNDLFVGAYLSDTGKLLQNGRVYIYEGSLLQNKDFSPSFVLFGENEKSWFGFDITVGDFNNNGIDDLIVSNFPYNKLDFDSSIKIYLGKKDFFDEKQISPNIKVGDAFDNALLSSKIKLADINDNGIDDLIIGAPVTNKQMTNSGKIYIIYGKNNHKKFYSINRKDYDFIIHGKTNNDWFGYNFTIGEKNNLIVGARYSNTENGINNGKIFVFPENFNELRIQKNKTKNEDAFVSRGEFIHLVLNEFDIKEKKSNFLTHCYSFKEFCLFNFMAMSSFDEIQLSPFLILYPDVFPNHKYSHDINTATILGLVHGYLDYPKSPFKPNSYISRIQALKIILGAIDAVPYKYQFELIETLGSYSALFNQFSYFKDIKSAISYMWWAPRYVNFAFENNIIEDKKYFRPNDNITLSETKNWINNTLIFLNKENNEETES